MSKALRANPGSAFYDETSALGARQVRSRQHAGAALFQWLVATTSNLLKWMQRRTFRQTQLARFGLKQLVERAFAIPALLSWDKRVLVLVLLSDHHLVRGLAQSWWKVRPKLLPAVGVQLRLPLILEPIARRCLHKI